MFYSQNMFSKTSCLLGGAALATKLPSKPHSGIWGIGKLKVCWVGCRLSKSRPMNCLSQEIEGITYLLYGIPYWLKVNNTLHQLPLIVTLMSGSCAQDDEGA